MRKVLISAEVLVYVLLSAGLALNFIPVAEYSNEIVGNIASALILFVFCTLFLLSANDYKNYFLFRTPLISFLILILCFSAANFNNFIISGDLFCIVIFSLALTFFASKGETLLFFPSLALFGLAIFSFVFYEKSGALTPTNVFFVSFSAISAFFAFVSSRFNNKMKIFKKEAELKERIAHKIQSIAKEKGKRRRF